MNSGGASNIPGVQSRNQFAAIAKCRARRLVACRLLPSKNKALIWNAVSNFGCPILVVDGRWLKSPVFVCGYYMATKEIESKRSFVSSIHGWKWGKWVDLGMLLHRHGIDATGLRLLKASSNQQLLKVCRLTPSTGWGYCSRNWS